MMCFKHKFSLVIYLMENIKKFFPIYVAVTGKEMIVAIVSVVILDMKGNGRDLTFQKLAAGNIVSVCVARVVAPSKVGRIDLFYKSGYCSRLYGRAPKQIFGKNSDVALNGVVKQRLDRLGVNLYKFLVVHDKAAVNMLEYGMDNGILSTQHLTQVNATEGLVVTRGCVAPGMRMCILHTVLLGKLAQIVSPGLPLIGGKRAIGIVCGIIHGKVEMLKADI